MAQAMHLLNQRINRQVAHRAHIYNDLNIRGDICVRGELRVDRLAINDLEGEDPSIHMNSPVIAKSTFTFVGPVKFQDKAVFLNPPEGINFIKPIDCHACMGAQVPGLEWGDEFKKAICMDCVYDSMLQFRAKESWAEKNGDPIRNCMNTISGMSDRVAELEKRMDSQEHHEKKKFDDTNYSQFL